MRIYQITFLLAICALIISPGLASELPVEPMLRIETGMHTARINRIDVDANEKTMVTASDDKTVRVWDLQTGRLRQILRVPSDSDDDGMLYAVAITPDGSSVAAGGWTKGDLNKKACIYIFDPDMATISDRITGLPDVINHLSFSKDGQYLAVALGPKGGLRIYLTRGWRLLAQDSKYGDASYWAAFANDGRLATACYDGYVRLYDPDFQLVIKKKIDGCKEPFSVAFAPNGKTIAVGFSDSAKVNVLSADDLSLLYAPDTVSVQYGDISSVAWSADENRLMAGGSYDDGSGMNPIRIWNNAGRGVFTDIAVSQNSIMQIRPLKNGNIVFAASDPCWGLLNRQGLRLLAVHADAPDYRGIGQSGFWVSYNGYRVCFALGQAGKRPAVFDLNSRTLLLFANNNKGMRRPVTQISECTLSQWQNSYSPKLNGKRLALDKKEMSYGLAWAPDRKSFLLGTAYYLRRFDRKGVLKWKTSTGGEVWGVNVSGNGQLGIAALADGSIRWYHIQNGRELLALFPHKDGKRWIVWTPSGYYATSAGGEDLIGWHVNRGRDLTPDFFPASRFRSVYYRPDVTANILTTMDEDEALRLANETSGKRITATATDIKKLSPPVVTILAPTDNLTITDTVVNVSYAIRNPSGEPLTGLKVMIDGRPVHKLKQTGTVPLKGQIDVPAPHKSDFSISLIAENRNAVSVATTVSLHRAAPSPKKIKQSPSAAKKSAKKKSAHAKKQPTKKTAPKAKMVKALIGDFVIKPKLYLLAIGVSDYQDKKMSLAYAVKDARDMAKILKRQKALYREVVIKLLADATRDQVLNGMEWLERATTDKDVGMIFLAGHGVNDNNGNYYFLPVEGTLKNLKRTGIPYHEIRNTISSLPGKVLAFIDTCHAGGIMGERLRGIEGDIDRIVNDLASAENGVVVFASSTGRQSAIENDKWKNGAFTKALVEGLSGKADYSEDTLISINELDLYISERVKVLTKGRQTPTTTKPATIKDFPIAITLEK